MKRFAKWTVIAFSALVVLVIVAAVAAGNKTPTVSVPAPPDIPSVASTAAPDDGTPSINPSIPLSAQIPIHVPSLPTAAPSTLLDISGQGTKSTQKFTASGDWDLAYTYNCANFGSTGNFAVEITADDPTTLELPVDELGMSGASVEHYHDPGTFYLQITSECLWTVKVTG